MAASKPPKSHQSYAQRLFFYILVNILPFLMFFQMIGLYQYALETEVPTSLGILCTVVEIEGSGRIQSCQLRHLFIDFDGGLLFPHGV